MSKYLFFFAASIAMLMSACDEGIVIGEDIINEEEIGTDVREDFDMSGRTTLGEPIYTYVDGRARRTHICGTIVDPVFGSFTSDLYVPLTYNGFPDYENAVLDSFILVIQYDTVGLYGDTLVSHDISVHQIEEKFVDRDSIDASETLGLGPLLGTKTVVPNYRDSVVIADRTNLGETISLPPQLRIRLETPEALALANTLLDDEDVASSVDNLQNFFKGIHISSTSEGDAAMLGLRFDASSVGALIMYTTKDDTLKEGFAYRFETQTFAHVEHDYAGSEVEAFIGDETGMGDSLLFVQGFIGLDSEVDLPDLSSFRSSIINKATLTFTVAELANDMPLGLYPIDRQLYGSQIDADGDRVLVDDIIKFGTDLNAGLTVFGGRPETVELSSGETVTQYKFNITDYVQRIIDDVDQDNKFIITPFSREQSPRNTVLYGPGHSTYPAKLRINYTEL